MAEFIKELIIELYKIRTYLIKIGPSRRQENICNKKLSEANVLYEQYNNYIEEIKRIKQFKSVSEIEDIDKSGVKFCNLYLEVTNLCKSEPIISATMAKFDLKIALNLLPVMNDTEAVTKQLIDGIEYYDSVLEDASKKELIEFVLKSRLSQFAKLRLAKKYGNVTKLLRDMKIHLLPKKSFTAISSKLQSIKQNEKTITDYGQELSSLFVDLTISQSEGHEESYDSLKRVNEKLAIKRFADGLRNRRLSTIIAARNYDSLSDAIQAAIDEETSSSDYTSSNIMSMRRSNRATTEVTIQQREVGIIIITAIHAAATDEELEDTITSAELYEADRNPSEEILQDVDTEVSLIIVIIIIGVHRGIRTSG
ncbi:hypothetical protein PYW08_013012 [Mythimna loreyi]|uniref:Uncharacterized protein n=1 Tax=Mythimna loreyi TaxID=667449 RepID=A0ACC2PYU3_9NEOP|nr:hypothetical protein PYW08_013012 [Mythimna loreyi]